MKIPKILFITLISFFLICTSVPAGSDSMMTDNYFNGRMWQLLNYSQKTIHLTGIQEGISLCLTQIKEDLMIPPDLLKSMKESGLFDRRRLLFSSQGVSNIADRIDGFYRDLANLNIPIIEAYRHITLGLNFATHEDLSTNLANLRRKYKK